MLELDSRFDTMSHLSGRGAFEIDKVSSRLRPYLRQISGGEAEKDFIRSIGMWKPLCDGQRTFVRSSDWVHRGGQGRKEKATHEVLGKPCWLS